MNTKRIFSYDIIRLAAILAVIMVHAAAPFVTNTVVGSFDFTTGNFFDSIARFAVPFFVMLSGALTLDEEKSFTTGDMVKKALSMLGLLAFWALFYALVYQVIFPLCTGGSVSAVGFLNSFVFGHFHLWYLFMLVGLYLITPVLRCFVRRDNAKIVRYFILLSVIFCFGLPVCNAALDLLLNGVGFGAAAGSLEKLNGKFMMDFAAPYPAYYLAGWYIAHVGLKPAHKKALYAAGAVGLAITFFGTQLTSSESVKGWNLFYGETTLHIFLYSAALFTFLHSSFLDRQPGRPDLVKTLSGLVFGVYILHVMILYVASLIFTFGPAPVQILLRWAFTAAVTFTVCFSLSKIPGVRKIIRG
ncbi:MAG: acyltransferase family protein [Oscillospiraceae bacterium]|nr:acyltransferase family protein [Oscillospiraceae bacterium]